MPQYGKDVDEYLTICIALENTSLFTSVQIGLKIVQLADYTLHCHFVTKTNIISKEVKW